MTADVRILSAAILDPLTSFESRVEFKAAGILIYITLLPYNGVGAVTGF